MELEYILNELSLDSPIIDQSQADAIMNTFVDVLKASRSIGISPNVRTHKALGEIELSSGYFISSWCSNQNIPKERRLYILKLLTNSPLRIGLSDELTADLLEIEVFHNGISGEGLTLAYLSENPVLSFNTHEKWQPNELGVQVKRLIVDSASESTELIESAGKVLNFCSVESLTSNVTKVVDLQRRRFASVEDFWSKKSQLFPHLEFSPLVRKNLLEIEGNKALLQQTFDLLIRMDQYCTTWMDGAFSIKTHIPNISPESQTTMQEFGELRKFPDDKGNHHICELHARLTPGANRLHFCGLQNSKKIFIGYVGKKLSSSQYRT